MSEKNLRTGRNPEIIVEAHGRLYIRGWEKDEVRAVGGDDSLTLEEVEGRVHAACTDGLELHVPQASSITLTAFDEATVRGVAGQVTVEQVGDSLTLREVGETTVKTIGNDLTARAVNGSLTVSQVGRFANVREVTGDFVGDFISGHANVKDISGNVRLETGGNANLYFDLSAERSVQVRSDGVITCRVAPGSDARVRISSRAQISVKVGDTQETTREGTFEGIFGKGVAELTLVADGPVSLIESRREKTAPEFDVDLSPGEGFAGLGAGIGEQISEQLEMIEEELEARLSGFSDMVGSLGLSVEKSERIHQRTKEKIERAQEKIQKAQERAARRIAEAQRRAEAETRRVASQERRAGRRSWNIDFGDIKKNARAKSDPVSDQERLMILNMVAEKKITLEEAEALLAALDGK